MSELPYSANQQYWIFQATPDHFDLKTGIKPGEYDNWQLNRFKQAVAPGDVVLLWNGGAQAGLYGWATVLDVSADRSGTNLQYEGALEAPLLRDELKAQPDLAGLTILRNPTGTNFRVTALEAQQLCGMMEAARPTPPPLPEKDEEDRHPGERLLDYRYSGTPQRVIDACVRYAIDSGNGTVFPRMIIQHVLALALHTDPDRPDSSSFLREFIPNLESLPLPFAASTDWARLSGRIDAASLGAVSVKDSALRLLAAARRAAILSTGRERISLRHLVAAVLHGGTAKNAQYLAELLAPTSLHPDTLKRDFLNYLAERWADDRKDGWATFFKEAAGSVEEQRTRQLLALLDADADRGIDHLNIRDEVRAFAALLAASDAKPPLAIGLFGDWGSGKTFFMKQVCAQVESLSADARARNEDKPLFCGRTAQVWFNAWHYSETDLWASLVDHFFRELKTQIEQIDSDQGSSRYKSLLRELDLSREDAAQLQNQVEKAEQKRQHLTQRRDELRIEIAAKRKLAEDLAAGESGGKVEDPLALDALRSHADELEKVLGIAGIRQKTADKDARLGELVELIRDSRQLKNQLGGFFSGVKNSASLGQLQWLLVVVLAAVAYLVFWSDFGLADWLKSGLGALVSGAVLLRKPISLTLGLLKLARKTIASFDRRKQSQSDRQVDEQQRLNSEIARLNGEIGTLNQRLKTSSGALEKLKSEYQELLRGSLFEFVLERVDSNQYQEHLGLLSTVRNDFEALDGLMSKQRTDEHNPELPTIDRIILYIDDLDRCPPERVVQVLEAIHLILAFPLFMVVVGVDARWVGRSLKEKYPFLVHFDGEPGQDHQTTDLYGASTDDYLEKIFQVPFWLKPIDGNTARDLIDGLLLDAKQREQQAQRDDAPPPGADDEGRQQSGEAGEGASDETEDEEAGFEETGEASSTTLEAAASMLSLSDQETRFMGELAPLVGRSPRTVKRFINLYRLFKASNARSQAPDFSTASGSFRAPMLLLAIATGRPRVCNRLFDQLCTTVSDEALLQAFELNKEAYPVAPAEGTDTESSRWTELNRLLHEFWLDESRRIPLHDLVGWLDDVARFGYREWRRR